MKSTLYTIRGFGSARSRGVQPSLAGHIGLPGQLGNKQSGQVVSLYIDVTYRLYETNTPNITARGVNRYWTELRRHYVRSLLRASPVGQSSRKQ
eukprot:scaffold63519_cov20-Prasinocladus_malaysianus.AAC.3